MFSSNIFASGQTPYTSMQFILTSDPNSVPISTLDSFDWATSDAIDVNSISFSKHNKPFLRFLRTFRDAKAFNGGSPDQLSHLLHILQQSILYFTKDHERMRQKLNLREAQVNSLASQIEDLKRQGQVASGRDIYYCPICLNGFDSYNMVDMHVEIQHPTLVDKWRDIRHPVDKTKTDHITSIVSSEIRPGTKTISQSDAVDAIGSEIHQKLEENSLTFQDIRNEMNARFQEFADLIRAHEFSSYTSYGNSSAPLSESSTSNSESNSTSYSTSNSYSKSSRRGNSHRHSNSSRYSSYSSVYSSTGQSDSSSSHSAKIPHRSHAKSNSGKLSHHYSPKNKITLLPTPESDSG
ncbi:hypothetical protein TRFO_37028 [Tritrichomonas foetus]|uniref:C2H2-type domain-containing protein n=1 Tax=Tritrichomonas foetus TaxID=1144522 RepID=A0A1J4JGZ6_9EUKA|nr:hypothetical protein TRFO_37028 [Tritrichomonas foetus]|eukprot:OHS96749.1 hypothetical protein TRFO_37028 [Tritrichomonas foetus]